MLQKLLSTVGFKSKFENLSLEYRTSLMKCQLRDSFLGIYQNVMKRGEYNILQQGLGNKKGVILRRSEEFDLFSY